VRLRSWFKARKAAGAGKFGKEEWTRAGRIWRELKESAGRQSARNAKIVHFAGAANEKIISADRGRADSISVTTYLAEPIRVVSGGLIGFSKPAWFA
jgi:hypothetical protein